MGRRVRPAKLTKSEPPPHKLDAVGLDFDPIAFLTLGITLPRGERFDETLASTQKELQLFAAAGGAE
jgi:hypothetical protein